MKNLCKIFLKKILTIIASITLFGFILHPIHLSITNITYSKKYFHIQTKIFKHDFVNAIEKFSNHTININKLSKEDKKIIEKYLQAHLYFTDNSTKLNNYKIKEIKFDNTYIQISFEIKIIYKKGQLILHNSLLTNIFPDQKNLTIIKINNLERGITFTSKKTESKI